MQRAVPTPEAPRHIPNRYPWYTSSTSSSDSSTRLSVSTINLSSYSASSPRASEMPLSPSAPVDTSSSLAILGFTPDSLTESSTTGIATSSSSSRSRTRRPSDPASYEVSDLDAKTIFASKQHSHALIDEHHRTRPDAAMKQEPVAAWKGLQIFEQPPLRFASLTVKVVDKRLQMKRYITHFQMHAVMDEITALLMPHHEQTADVSVKGSNRRAKAVISPEIVQSSSLWRPSAVAAPLCSTWSGRQQTWTAIQWVVHKMPTLLTQDRNYVLLEHHHTFTTKTSKRGYVQLLHSTDAPHFDPGVAHGSKRLTRGTMYQSGVVVLESESTPGLLHVSVAMEVDFFGTYSPLQHRHVVIKRLSKWSELRGLVWKKRMAESGKLVLISSSRRAKGLSASRVPTSPDCELCLLRAAVSARGKAVGPRPQGLARCQCCQRRVCLECTRRIEFPAFLVDVAMECALARQHPSSTVTITALSEAALKHAKKNEGAVAATLCTGCIHKYVSGGGSSERTSFTAAAARGS